MTFKKLAIVTGVELVVGLVALSFSGASLGLWPVVTYLVVIAASNLYIAGSN